MEDKKEMRYIDPCCDQQRKLLPFLHLTLLGGVPYLLIEKIDYEYQYCHYCGKKLTIKNTSKKVKPI